MVAPVSQPAVDNVLATLRLDRARFRVHSIDEQPKAWEEYAHLSHEERMLALEAMRQNAYGYEACSRRLQRVLEIAQRSEG